jgi:hypothetical protein
MSSAINEPSFNLPVSQFAQKNDHSGKAPTNKLEEDITNIGNTILKKTDSTQESAPLTTLTASSAKTNKPESLETYTYKVDPDYRCDDDSDDDKTFSMCSEKFVQEFSDLKFSDLTSKNPESLEKVKPIVQDIQNLAARIAEQKNIPLHKSYQVLIGAMDRLDQGAALSNSFAIRCAILEASYVDVKTLPLWTICTTGPKPTVVNSKSPFANEGFRQFIGDKNNWLKESFSDEADKFLERYRSEGLISLDMPIKTSPMVNKLCAFTKQPEKISQKKDVYEIDTKFTCDEKTYATYKKTCVDCVNTLENGRFNNISSFLAGHKTAEDEVVFKQMVETISDAVKEMMANTDTENISLEDAYKLFVGAVDRFDQEQIDAHKISGEAVQSTFALRSAILAASHKDGAGLESWTLHTKGPKPKPGSASDWSDPQWTVFWAFLDDWKNWIPEVCGVFATFSAKVLVQAIELIKDHPDQSLVALKGPFGSGKTFNAAALLEIFGGIVAPDEAKQVVRLGMPEIPHSAVHKEGSQIAYRLFNNLITQLSGTIVYDSSLSEPSDLTNLITKAEKAGKKGDFYDFSRMDDIRILSVLKRTVNGKDPRVPVSQIINASVNDKMKRLQCMEVVLNRKAKDKKSPLNPVYHFMANDAQGKDTQEVLTLGTDGRIEVNKQFLDRLGQEFLSYDESSNKISLTISQKELEKNYETKFLRSVNEIANILPPDQLESMKKIFSGRVLVKQLAKIEPSNPTTLYGLLDDDVREAIGDEAAFASRFDALDEDTKNKFFNDLKKMAEEGKPLSYWDLPLTVALTIHEKLLSDPWNEK